MHGDLSDGAKIAITLIILGVIISTVFTILQFSRSVTSQGIQMVENSMNAMSLAKFDDYDQNNGMSGTQVKSAMKLFDGQQVAILVGTKAIQSSTYGADNANGTYAYFNYGAKVTAGTAGDNTVVVEKAADATKYKAPLVTVNGKSRKESYYTIDLKMAANGTIEYHNDRLWTDQSGKLEFIRTTAKFRAELIKDNTGTIVGIVFTQH